MNTTLPSFSQVRVGKGIPLHSQDRLTDCPSITERAAGSSEENEGGTAWDKRRV